jgi:small acid-soluble spore protein N (minor)
MSNPKKDSKHFVPENIGMKPKAAGGNKGKQMQDKSGHQPVVKP